MPDPMIGASIEAAAIEQLFLSARTHTVWRDIPVTDRLLRQVYELAVMGPTSANCLPMRVCFVRTPEAKARLVPLMDRGNQEKTRTAPATAIVAYDLDFHMQLRRLYPHAAGAAGWFTSSPAATRDAALRNGSLQGGYFIMAARALGLDCGPMGGFNGPAVAQEFFPGLPYVVNFICNLGYGAHEALHPRLPRLGFKEACSMV